MHTTFLCSNCLFFENVYSARTLLPNLYNIYYKHYNKSHHRSGIFVYIVYVCIIGDKINFIIIKTFLLHILSSFPFSRVRDVKYYYIVNDADATPINLKYRFKYIFIFMYMYNLPFVTIDNIISN